MGRPLQTIIIWLRPIQPLVIFLEGVLKFQGYINCQRALWDLKDNINVDMASISAAIPDKGHEKHQKSA